MIPSFRKNKILQKYLNPVENRILHGKISKKIRFCSQLRFPPWNPTTYFKGHSTRGAGVSKAKSRGANPNQLMLQGYWSNVTTLEKHYDRPILGPALSDLILEH